MAVVRLIWYVTKFICSLPKTDERRFWTVRPAETNSVGGVTMQTANRPYANVYITSISEVMTETDLPAVLFYRTY